MNNLLHRLFGSKQKPEPRAFGALPDTVDYRDISTASFTPIKLSFELPDKHMADLSKLEVFDQKQNGSCVGQSLAAIATYYWLKEYGTIDYKSARHIYARAKAIDGIPDQQGTYPRVAASLFREEGIAPQSLISNDNTLPHYRYVDINVTPEVEKKSKEARVQGYAFSNLDTISLMTDLVQFDVLSASLAVGDWNHVTGQAKPPAFVTGSTPRHQIVLTGYEKSGGKVKVFFRNSWGKSWGKNGNGWFWLNEYLSIPNGMDSVIAYTDIPIRLIEEAKSKPYQFTRTLRLGSRGKEVMELQKRLNIKPADGIFGPITEDAVMEWQEKHNLTVDGIIGKQSRAVLNKALDFGAEYDLYPAVYKKASKLIRLARLCGMPIRITDSFRSIEEQDALYAQGRTEPGDIVTNAPGGYSYHNYGVAFDVVFETPDGGITYEGDWEKLGEMGEILDLEWGGRWTTPDRPHFQMTLGYEVEEFLRGEVDYQLFN